MFKTHPFKIIRCSLKSSDMIKVLMKTGPVAS